MRRILVVAAVAAGLVGMAAVADAATNIVNKCTSTYQLTGMAAELSGSDTAIVRKQGLPVIQVTKKAKNLRTGIEDLDQVNAISGDTILFTIEWSNAGEADADIIVLTDYIPEGMTFVDNSGEETSSNVNTHVMLGNNERVQYTATGVKGTDSGAPANGVIRFKAKVN